MRFAYVALILICGLSGCAALPSNAQNQGGPTATDGSAAGIASLNADADGDVAAELNGTASSYARNGQYFTYQGARIFYQVSGSGQPMLLIHGYPLSGQLFAYQRPVLSKSYRFITLDLPGYGRSSTPNSSGSIEAYAKDVLALLDHLKISKAIIGGHSMGGVITMEMFREAPQRFTGMVLIDTNPKPATVVEKAEFPAFGVQAKEVGVDSIPPLLLPIMLTGATIQQQPQKTAILTKIIEEASVNAFIAGGQALAERSDYEATLKTVKVPTLILEGQDDPLWAFPLDELMHELISESTLAILPGSGHASIFNTPDEANNAILKWAKNNVH